MSCFSLSANSFCSLRSSDIILVLKYIYILHMQCGLNIYSMQWDRLKTFDKKKKMVYFDKLVFIAKIRFMEATSLDNGHSGVWN